MGVAYYVVVNSDEPGYDSTIDGKALARHRDRIDIIATRLGFRCLDAYCSLSRAEASDHLCSLLGIDDVSNLPTTSHHALDSMPSETWFEADLGLAYATALSDHIESNRREFSDSDAILHDLSAMARVMNHAKQAGHKWHLQVDY